MNVAAETAKAFQAFAERDYAEAANRARRILRHSPNDPAALTLFGRLALNSQEPDIARQIFERLLQTSDQRAATWLDLTEALRGLRRDQEAIQAVQHTLSFDRDNIAALLKLGEIQLSLGQWENASDAFRRVLKLDDACVAAYRGLCQADDVVPQSPFISRMEKMARESALSPREAAELHYSLAQVYRRAARADEFIHHLFAANAKQRAPLPDGRAQYEEMFDRLDSAFTDSAFRRAPRADPVAPTPIFILGMPRSGTTLVEQLVAANPDVTPGGEIDYMRGPLRRALERGTHRPFPLGFDELSATTLNALARAYARRLSLISAGSVFVTDKTPGNFHVLGLLRILFPGSKIIHVARDPMDTCFSILQYPFDDRSPHTCDIELLAYTYSRYVRLMGRWQELFGKEFITVEYERLVESPAEEARRVYDYCGLEWHETYLEFHRAPSAVRTFSATQVRRPIYTSSVGGWRSYSGALQPLRQALECELQRSGGARTGEAS